MHSVAIALVVLIGFTMTSTAPTACPPSNLDEVKKAETALSNFAVNFFKTVSSTTKDKNAVLSPISVALALSLLETGADGSTRAKIRDLLAGISTNTSMFQTLQKQIQISDDKTKVTVANGIFPQKGFNLIPQYVTEIKECFESEAENVDYSTQLEQTRQKINSWVSGKTANKIPELFKPGVLTPDVVLVLANAIYFKAGWSNAFYDGNTKPGTFYKLGKEEQQVQFMKQTALYRYASESNLDALELGYSHKDLAMYILLPKTKDGLQAMEQDLTGEKLKGIISRLQPKQVRVELPRFVIRTPVDLKEILVKMGLDIIFSDSANFGRMSTTALKVSKAVHQAYINVNENGTEAAAATGFAMVLRSGAPTNPEPFIVDHPFLYAIVHKPTGAILFLGKVNYVKRKRIRKPD